jgi:hypothetical protein
MQSSRQNEWQAAISSLKLVAPRQEISLVETSAPTRLAPHAVAIIADINDAHGDELASGKFILLHDPDGQEVWDGQFRVVTFLRAAVEREMVEDSLLDEAMWTWLTDALDSHDATQTALSGTITRTLSSSFGELENREDENEIEIRASWTPLNSDAGAALKAWLELLSGTAGLVPIPAGVSALPRKVSR